MNFGEALSSSLGPLGSYWYALVRHFMHELAPMQLGRAQACLMGRIEHNCFEPCGPTYLVKLSSLAPFGCSSQTLCCQPERASHALVWGCRKVKLLGRDNQCFEILFKNWCLLDSSMQTRGTAHHITRVLWKIWAWFSINLLKIYSMPNGLQTWDVDCTVNEFLLFQFRSRTTFVLAGCISMWLCGTPCASDGMFDPRAF